MTLRPRTSITTTLTLASALALAGCSDDGGSGFSAGLEGGNTDPGTESASDSASGNSDSDSASGNSDSDSASTDSDSDSASTDSDSASGNSDSDSASTDSDSASGNSDSDSDSDTDPSSSSAGTGTKFDLGEIGDLGDAGEGLGGPGSCRSSEIYGASGGFPTFEDPAFADFLDRTIAIVTHNRQNGGGDDNVITIVDISGEPPPPNMYYEAPLYYQPHWDLPTLGKIFGLTLDSAGNIYVASSTVYGATANAGRIQKIDGVTGEISEFVNLPNNGPGLGNINYDCVSETIYASNHEDGRIYQIDMDGDIVSTYKHATGEVTIGPANDQGEPNGAFVPLGDRVWAVQSHAGRLYYSTWVEHSNTANPNRNNEVWSVEYVNNDGIVDPGTAVKEFDVPNDNSGSSQPVSDLSFAHDGWMLIAQRTMWGDMQTGAHRSTTFDYDYQDGEWVWQGTNYVVGELLPYSAAGGVDHDFVENGYVWMTGDALDFYTPDVVYGLQGTPYGGGGIENSTLIDLDHEITGQDKTVYGDVELPIPGDVNPVPPPG